MYRQERIKEGIKEKMKITLTEIPKPIISLFFSPKNILFDKKCCEWLYKTKPFIFGKETGALAEKAGFDIYDLIFFGEKPLCDCMKKYLYRYSERERELLGLAHIIRRLYKGETVKLLKIEGYNGEIIVGEPVFLSLSIIDSGHDYSKLNARINRKSEKNYIKDKGLNDEAENICETVRIAALKLSMKKALDNKELIDKYNFRRFSSRLKLNNRPATIDEINRMLVKRKVYTFADLSQTRLRLNFTALYAISYMELTLEDLYGSDTVFLPDSKEKDELISKAASDLIGIINNGNGVEIANMFVSMIIGLTEAKIPKADILNLSEIMDNYSIYYAVASLASTCESLFSLNGEIKKYMKSRLIDSYWKYTNRLIALKGFSSVAVFCYRLSELDVKKYRNSKTYREEILYYFEAADNFLKEFEKGDDLL